MKICMLVEGSYPYITGGVSAWVQMLISSLPEHEFAVYSVGAQEKSRGRFIYTLPENITQVTEVFLDSIMALSVPQAGRYAFSPEEAATLTALICGESGIDLGQLVRLFRKRSSRGALEILMSFDFFDVMTAAYQRKYDGLPFTDYFWTVRSMLLPLFFLINQNFPQADVYHSVATGYAGIIGSLAASLHDRPFILTEHGIYAREREEELIKASWVNPSFKGLWISYFYNLARMTYGHASRVVSLFGVNRDLQIAHGCDPAKTLIIPNGIDISAYSAASPAPEERDRVVIGAIARVVPVKDIVTMIRSFALVARDIPDARFVIVGPTDEDSEYYDKCVKLAATLGLANLEFTGNVQVAGYLATIDILVLTSISEGQPLAMLEGMAGRKPFVSTDVGSCRELLEGDGDGLGAAGIVVPVMDFAAIAKAIVSLAKNRSLRRRMGEAGFARVSLKHTVTSLVSEYRKLYADVSAGGRA